MKNQIEEKVRKFGKVEKELFVEIVQKLKQRKVDMVEEAFKDMEKLSDLDREELFNAVKMIEGLRGNESLLTQRVKKEILNRTLLRTLDL